MDSTKEIKITPTWGEVGSFSRYYTWRYADVVISNWLLQKKFQKHKLRLLRSFAKHAKLKCSLTDSLILAYQNFKEFREYSNAKMKELENNNSSQKP
jgi:hypothetical protein